ncbi:MAG: C4-dicarboxylate ABC transporter substrate-binding protein [Alphaproteobacteria bacterium]|nr:C4-dicarboxylate ABC transporter substrate-binding protein [Alphaproteobacteria bacterium]
MSYRRTLLVLSTSLVLITGASAADVRFLASWDKTNPAISTVAEPFTKGVETATKGSIKFIISGPETVPPFEQLQPATTGVFQMLFTHGIYHYGTTGMAVPLDATRGTIEQRRNSGLYEVIDRHYQKLGLKLVALPISATRGYHIVLRAPVSPEGDLKGRKIRGTPSYHAVINMLGASPVVLPGGEVYSALEKGVVDGAAWPASGVLPMRWHEVAKYLLRPSFGLNHYLLLANLNSWNRLSQAERDIMLAEGRKVEELWFNAYDKMVQDEEAALIQRGMQITEMGAEQKAKLQAAWASAQWELAEKKNGQEARDLRALLRSKGLTD